MSEHSAKKEIKITPVPVSYVDSLWVSYVVSVLAAWVAEFGKYIFYYHYGNINGNIF